MSIQNVNLSGNMQDMTYDEYMRLFDQDAGEWTDEMYNRACLVFVHTRKSVNECNAQEIQETIQIMSGLMNALVVRHQKYKAKLSDIEEHCSENEREEIRKRDKAYKPKKDNNGNPTENWEYKKKVSQSKEDKLRAGLVAMGMPEDQIDAFLIKNRK